jgi:hypothetical protein
MGRKVSDGGAVNLTVPGGDAVSDGELYRIGGINGFAIGDVVTTDTDRTKAFDINPSFIYSIHVPSGVNPAAGALLYWATPGSFQAGPTNLQTTPATQGDFPCFFVTQARSADPDGGYVLRGRVLNGVTGDSIGAS